MTVEKFGDGRDWFFEKRFGLFVHWGLYAIPAWHEQIQWRRRVPRAEYAPLLREFDPAKYDPAAWLDLAEEVGMEYICFTTKHHDGFCLWDTAQTDYKVTNAPYGRDTLAMLAEACHKRDFPLCLYYSVVDWHHPNYPNQDRSHELAGPEPGDKADFGAYMAFLKAQVEELCTQYGEIHGFWWDMNVTGHTDPSINNRIRELQPKAVINNRGFDDGDFGTPEREYNKEVGEIRAFARPTEACNSVGVESWGYKADEDFYSRRHLIAGCDAALAKGGNYLLNVGPKADGTIDAKYAAALRGVGTWYHRVREAFGPLGEMVPASHMTQNQDVLLTRCGDAVYVHLNAPPARDRVLLAPMQEAPKRAVLLNTGEPVAFGVDELPHLHQQEQKAFLRLRGLPVDEFADEVLVVKLEF